MSCDLCGSTTSAEAYAAEGPRWRHVRCADCGLLRVDPLPPDLEALNRATYGGPSTGRERPLTAAARAWLARARRDLGEGGRLLDVGCGSGVVLAAASAVGLRAAGVEPEPAPAERARAQGLSVTTGTLADLPSGPGFDLIRIHQVLEHVSSPRALLEAAGRLLRPGGAIHVSTPNEHGLAHQVLGARWRMLGHSGNGHLVLLSPAALRRYASELGLELQSLSTRGLRAWSRNDERHRLVRRGWRWVEQVRGLFPGERGDELLAVLRGPPTPP